jgi:transcriptional regulator with XRE-family HTH domain
MDYSRIKVELELKRITIRELCIKIDITEQGLHQMIRKKSMKIETLERISQVLGLSVSYWFEGDGNTINLLSNEMGTNSPNGKKRNPKVVDEKIDSLTKNLNEVLKVMASK